jgi:hypothetical protein
LESKEKPEEVSNLKYFPNLTLSSNKTWQPEYKLFLFLIILPKLYMLIHYLSVYKKFVLCMYFKYLLF